MDIRTDFPLNVRNFRELHGLIHQRKSLAQGDHFKLGEPGITDAAFKQKALIGKS